MALGYLDWNSSLLPNWIQFGIGPLLIFIGLSFAIWGIRTLGIHMTSGLKDALIKSGPYKISRNPQYLGDIVAMVGFAMFTNSIMVTVVNTIGILTFIATPIAEEPWLRKRYGKKYVNYSKQVPRFLKLF